ncbi:MAG: DUF493 domain-containing protein [Gammaproteobacteria bacterium]|nr:DUF493 domain-containing protein [Gammaproteobacteria bacterium]
MSQEEETLFEFPCEFCIKTMGQTTPDLEAVVQEIVSPHVPGLTAENLRSQSSKEGKYTSVSITFQATSKAQLDAIYQALTDHERIVMSL